VTTEQLRLEIEVAAKEALKNLSATSDEYKRLAKEAKAAVPPANELKDTMARLQADLKKNETAARLFDDKLGGLKERQALLRGAMLDLIDKGIAPEAKEMQHLKLEYDAAAIASKELETRTGTMSGSFADLQSSLGAIGAVKAFTTVATGVLDAGKAAVQTAGDYEMLKANFETLTGSTAAATAEFNQLKQFANVTPFDLQGVAKSAQILQAAKVPVEDLTLRLGQLGDLSLGNNQKFESMVGAFSKMAIKGKVDLEQLNIVMESGVPILDELAKGYGKTSEEVFDMLSKGKVSTEDFIKAMERMTSEGGQFFGGMARGAQTYTGVLSTYKDSIDGVRASFGELMLPAVKAVLGALTSLNSAIASSPLLKGVLAGVLVTAVALLGAWAVAMAASVVKTWLAYAAEMALNAARAVGNPLLLAAIAAVGVATAGYIAYASAQGKATEAAAAGAAQAKLTEAAYKDMSIAMREATTKSGNTAAAQEAVEKLRSLKAELVNLERQAASSGSSLSSSLGRVNSILADKINPNPKNLWEGFRTEAEKVKAAVQAINDISDKDVVNAIKRSKQYQDAVAKGSSTAIAAALKTINGTDAKVQARIEAIKAEIEKIESGVTITPKVEDPKPSTLSDDAKKWIEAWNKAYADAQAAASSNPYASLDNEKAQKLADAAANGVTTATAKETIDEINAYYASKRKALAGKLAAEEQAALAKLTDTKLDDLNLEQAAQIASLNDLETKALAAEDLTQAEISAITAKYAAMRATVNERYAKQYYDTQTKEAAEAAAAAFDLANKERAAAAMVSDSKIDDLELQRDRELSIAAARMDSEDQIARLRMSWDERIAKQELEDARTYFARRKEWAQDQGNVGAYIGASTGEAIQGTEVGSMIGMGGGNPWIALAAIVVKVATSLESFQKTFNGISGLIKATAEVVEPILNSGIDEMLGILTDMFEELGKVGLPLTNIFLVALKGVAFVLETLQPIIKFIGWAFTWLNDYVIVPVGNAIIAVINIVIKGINALFGWMGVSLDQLGYLKNSKQAAEEQAEIAEKLKAVNAQIEAVTELFTKKKQELKDAYDKNVGALRNLLELGAITESDYASRIAKANDDYDKTLADLQSQEDAQLAALEAIRDQLQSGINVDVDNKVDLADAMADAFKEFFKGVGGGVSDFFGEIGGWFKDVGDGIADFFGFDVGAVEIPHDMPAKVHKGEIIVPKSFSDGLRNGDLTLGSGKGGTSVYYQTTVHVAGSVLAENDLADKITRTQARRKHRGALETDE
jgi:tape measure domain-containing protein